MTKNKMAQKTKVSIDALLLLAFTDVAYTVLPLITILVLRFATFQSLEDFLLLPELSFASIVFYGFSIKYFMELKITHQRDFSAKLYTGPQVMTLLLILSVLTLALVEWNEKEKKLNKDFLTGMQIVLFMGGLAAVFIFNYFKFQIVEARNNLEDSISKTKYYSIAENFLDMAVYGLESFVSTSEKIKAAQLANNLGNPKSNRMSIMARRRIESALDDIEQYVKEARNAYNNIQDNS